MLSTLIGRITGKDRWLETEATVTSSEVVSEGGYRKGWPTARIAFQYRDSAGDLQYGEIEAGSMTPTYNLQAGDTFSIRYNPHAPDRYYCPEASSLDIDMNLWVIGGVAGLAMIIIQILRKHR